MSVDWEQFAEQLLKDDLARPGQIVGCSEAEIAALEKQAGLRFPPAYRGFLNKMGHGAGELFQGTDLFYRHVQRNLRPHAEKLLAKEVPGLRLSADAFVFSMHQGYEFCYFLAGEGDDPPVYQFVEGQGAPKRLWDSFSAYILAGVEQHQH